MAHTNRYQLGAHWVRSQVQNGIGTPPIVRKVVATANTLGVFAGDFLDETADGVVYPATTGGGATPQLAYVCVGVERYLGADGKIRKGTFLPAATAFTGDADLSNPKASVVLCIPVTGQIFALTVPTAAASVATAATYVGQCTDITPGSGSTVTGQSATTVVDPTVWESTTTSGQLRLFEIPQIGLSQQNDVTVENWTGHFVAYEIRGII